MNKILYLSMKEQINKSSQTRSRIAQNKTKRAANTATKTNLGG